MADPNGTFAKIRASIAHLGVRVFVLLAFRTAIERLTAGRIRVTAYRFVAQPVASQADAPASGRGSIETRFAGIDDPLVAQFPRPRAVIERRFADGAVCIVAHKEHRFAGFLWLQTPRYVEDEVRCVYEMEPAGAAAWDFDVYVEPHFRFGKTFVRLWDAARAHLRQRGLAWTMSRISLFKPESLRAHERLGAQRLGDALFFSGKRHQIVLFNLPPYFHAGGPGSSPMLRLKAPNEVPLRHR